MGFILELFVLMIFFFYTSSLEWNTHSLLQIGPCPPSSGIISSLDIQQLKGRWIIEQLPSPFPQCCRQPTLNFAEVTQQLQKKISSRTTASWIRMGLDWITCNNRLETLRQPHNLRLWNSHVNEGTFLLELPWPLNAIGFSTLNFVSIDYKKYAAGYVCHSFLMEHVAIPFIIVRPQTSLDITDWQRLKWALIKQGVSSAWTLTETKGQCNEVSNSGIEEIAEDSFDDEIHSNSSEAVGLAESTESNNGLTLQSEQDHSTPDVESSKEVNTTETTSTNPDAEWITTKFTKVHNRRPTHPEGHPPVLWPAILMEDPIDGDSESTPSNIQPLIAPLTATERDVKNAEQ